MAEMRKCIECGNDFLPLNNQARMCSQKCRSHRNNAISKLSHAAKPLREDEKKPENEAAIQDAKFVAAMIEAVAQEMEAAFAAGVPEHVIPQLAERYERRDPVVDYTPAKLTPLAEFGAI